MKPLQTLLTAGPVLAALVCASPALAGDKSAPKSDAAAEAPKLAVPDAARFQLAARYSAARKGVSLLVLHKGRRIAVDTPRALCEQTDTTSLGAAFLALTGEAPKKKEETV